MGEIFLERLFPSPSCRYMMVLEAVWSRPVGPITCLVTTLFATVSIGLETKGSGVGGVGGAGGDIDDEEGGPEGFAFPLDGGEMKWNWNRNPQKSYFV